jgi:hypothetical protein
MPASLRPPEIACYPDRMPAEISEITLSDRELLEVIFRQQQHMIADIEDLMRVKARLDPLIAQFASPVAAYTAGRRARKAAANGH